MFYSKSKEEISNLKAQLDDLKTTNDQLAYANKVYRERLEAEYAQATYAVDFQAMNAFSVERMWDNGTQKTVIGYMLTEPVSVTEGTTTTKDVVREWTLYCSHAEHQRLVEEFNQYVKSKE